MDTLDFEPWWLIFVPLLFALGWIAARVDIRQMLSEHRSLPKSYFKGLNFLLNEEPDRAIDAFVEVAKLDPETTELHFALGSLFRRRGEMERAIRVHQSLLSRADLPVQDREQAQHELAQDFLKAGMLDRAEQAFELVQETRFAVPAIRALVRIYESVHDWDRAIDAVKRLRALVEEPVPQLAHYHCERAVAALAQRPSDATTALEALDVAERVAAEGGEGSQAARARIAMLRAQLARAADDPAREGVYLASVLAKSPAYGSLVASELMASHRRQGTAPQGLTLLRQHYAQQPSLDVFNVVFRELRAQQGIASAWTFAREALRAQPSLLGLDRLLDAELASRQRPAEAAEAAEAARDLPLPALFPAAAADDGSVADLALLRTLIHRHTQRLDRYACQACGFEARRFYWQCPGCNGWETYPPRRLEELR